jgi:hypothetical protein
MYDLNDAELPRGFGPIPNNTLAMLTVVVRPGGIDGQGEVDRGLLRAAKTPGSDVLLLDCEFTVAAGPHVRRKFWQVFPVVGGKVDEHGVSIGWRISNGIFRAMIDSAHGLDPLDMSEAAKAKWVLRGLADLSGITFAAKIRVEPANDPRYRDSNRLDRVVLPGEPEYRRIMDGEAVAPQPSNRAPRAAVGAAASAPRAWERPSAANPVQSAPTPATTGPAWLNG